jgi:hypothetical protein
MSNNLVSISEGQLNNLSGGNSDSTIWIIIAVVVMLLFFCCFSSSLMMAYVLYTQPKSDSESTNAT